MVHNLEQLALPFLSISFFFLVLQFLFQRLAKMADHPLEAGGWTSLTRNFLVVYLSPLRDQHTPLVGGKKLATTCILDKCREQFRFEKAPLIGLIWLGLVVLIKDKKSSPSFPSGWQKNANCTLSKGSMTVVIPQRCITTMRYELQLSRDLTIA